MDVSNKGNSTPELFIPTSGNSQGHYLHDGLLFLADGHRG